MTKKPVSVKIDPELIEIVDRCIELRSEIGEEVSRSQVTTEALVDYLSALQDVLISELTAAQAAILQLSSDIEQWGVTE